MGRARLTDGLRMEPDKGEMVVSGLGKAIRMICGEKTCNDMLIHVAGKAGHLKMAARDGRKWAG